MSLLGRNVGRYMISGHVVHAKVLSCAFYSSEDHQCHSKTEKETVLSVVERLESTFNTTIEAVLNEVGELGTAVLFLNASKELTTVNVFFNSSSSCPESACL